MSTYLAPFTFEEVARITEEYAGLNTSLYEIGKLLRYHHPEFKKFLRSGFGASQYIWEVHQIETVNPSTKTAEVCYRCLTGNGFEEITVKLPISLLNAKDAEQLEEQVKLFCELLEL